MSKGTWGAQCVFLGLLLTLGGTGGVETSLDTVSMIQAGLISLVGLVIMWLGTRLVQEQTDRNLGRCL